MTVKELAPAVLGCTLFSYKTERPHSRLGLAKTQYSHRLLLPTEGEVGLTLGDGTGTLRVGDLAYLTPGAVYRLSPLARDFTLLSVCFDLVPEEPGRPLGCVFLSQYRPALLPPPRPIPEAPELGCPALLSGLDCRDLLAPLLGGQDDPLAPLHATAAVLGTLSRLLRHSRRATRTGAAEPILAYIREHPEGDLTSAALSRRFSYHKNYLNALVKGACGRSLSALVRSVKIAHAVSLLSEGALSPTEIAARLGYYDYSHFYRAFLAETGTRPTAYLRG